MSEDTAIYTTDLEVRNLSQPDAVTCQSACIAMVCPELTIREVRTDLLTNGAAGDPYNMGRILKREHGVSYEFYDDASLSDVREWLKQGDFLIAHGYLTRSGHVIGLDGVAIDTERTSYKISVKDPWSEFNGKTFSYDLQSKFYDGYYSSYLMFAAFVASNSYDHARQIYREGRLDSSLKNAWIHRIIN